MDGWRFLAVGGKTCFLGVRAAGGLVRDHEVPLLAHCRRFLHCPGKEQCWVAWAITAQIYQTRGKESKLLSTWSGTTLRLSFSGTDAPQERRKQVSQQQQQAKTRLLKIKETLNPNSRWDLRYIYLATRTQHQVEVTADNGAGVPSTTTPCPVKQGAVTLACRPMRSRLISPTV